ncbi:hypothetical protein OG866_08775 [Streptomyces sp. NBC_00663]|nr:hypothetical protein [Streptomyces sp. NBC_00663]
MRFGSAPAAHEGLLGSRDPGEQGGVLLHAAPESGRLAQSGLRGVGVA